MLIGVHTIKLDLKIIPDNYSLTGTEVVIDGKRRERYTKKGFWTDNIKEVTNFLEKHYCDEQYRLETEMAALTLKKEQLTKFLHAQIKEHNNAFLD